MTRYEVELHRHPLLGTWTGTVYRVIEESEFSHGQRTEIGRAPAMGGFVASRNAVIQVATRMAREYHHGPDIVRLDVDAA